MNLKWGGWLSAVAACLLAMAGCGSDHKPQQQPTGKVGSVGITAGEILETVMHDPGTQALIGAVQARGCELRIEQAYAGPPPIKLPGNPAWYELRGTCGVCPDGGARQVTCLAVVSQSKEVLWKRCRETSECGDRRDEDTITCEEDGACTTCEQHGDCVTSEPGDSQDSGSSDQPDVPEDPDLPADPPLPPEPPLPTTCGRNTDEGDPIGLLLQAQSAPSCPAIVDGTVGGANACCACNSAFATCGTDLDKQGRHAILRTIMEERGPDLSDCSEDAFDDLEGYIEPDENGCPTTCAGALQLTLELADEINHELNTVETVLTQAVDQFDPDLDDPNGLREWDATVFYRGPAISRSCGMRGMGCDKIQQCGRVGGCCEVESETTTDSTGVSTTVWTQTQGLNCNCRIGDCAMNSSTCNYGCSQNTSVTPPPMCSVGNVGIGHQ